MSGYHNDSNSSSESYRLRRPLSASRSNAQNDDHGPAKRPRHHSHHDCENERSHSTRRENDNTRDNDDNDAEYYEEYRTGRRLLISHVGCSKWSKIWLLNNLNTELRRYGTENAVIDAYKDGSRWVIKVVNADLAAKLRKKLYYTRNWWVYGFDAKENSFSKISPHQPSPPRKHSKYTTMYIKAPPSCNPNHQWLVGHINGQMRKKHGFRGEAIIDAIETKTRSYWIATAANSFAVRKLHEMYPYNHSGGWQVSMKPLQPINQTAVILYIRPASSYSKEALRVHLNGYMIQKNLCSSDAIVNISNRDDSCWALEVANYPISQQLWKVLEEDFGWLVSTQPITQEWEPASLNLQGNNSMEQRSEGPKSKVMVLQRPPVATDGEDLVSFLNHHIEQNSLCPSSEPKPTVLSATRRHYNQLETCWTLQVTSELARDNIIGMDDVAFQTSTLSFHDLSFNNETDEQERSPTKESRGTNDAGADSPPRSNADPTNGTGGTKSPGTPFSRSEGEISDMEKSVEELPNAEETSSQEHRGEVHRADDANQSAQPESATTVADLVPRNEPQTGRNEQTGQQDCQISLIDHKEKEADEATVNNPAAEKVTIRGSGPIHIAATPQQDKADTVVVADRASKPPPEGQHQLKAPTTPARSPGKNATHLLHQAQKLAEEAKQEAEQNRLRKELGHATRQFVKQLERVKELELNNQSLTQIASEGQRLLATQQTASETAIQEMKRARSEAAAAVGKLATVEGQLNAIHSDWQEQCNEIEELKAKLLAQQNELDKERSIREDTERRYRDVTESLTLQTNELARERRARQHLERYLVKRRNEE